MVPEVPPKRSRKKQVWVPKSTATKIVNTSKAGNEEKVENVDHPKGELHFDDKHATLLPSGIKKQAPFDENILSEWTRNERIQVDYLDEKL